MRAVAKETRKWEEREARFVRRIEELELARSAAVVPGGLDTVGTDGGVGRTLEGKERGASATTTMEPASIPMSSRCVLTDNSDVGGEVTSAYLRDKPGNSSDRRDADWGRGGFVVNEGGVGMGGRITGGGLLGEKMEAWMWVQENVYHMRGDILPLQVQGRFPLTIFIL